MVPQIRRPSQFVLAGIGERESWKIFGLKFLTIDNSRVKKTVKIQHYYILVRAL